MGNLMETSPPSRVQVVGIEWDSASLENRDDAFAEVTTVHLLRRIREKQKWLIGSDIQAWMRLLHIDTSHSVSNIKSHSLPGNDGPVIAKGKMIKILHVNGNHWIVVSNVFSPADGLSIYDSAFCKDSRELYQTNVVKDICELLGVADKRTEIDFPMTRRQLQDGDCGPFALAYSAALCFGIRPETIDVGGEDLRYHLASIYEKKKITLSDFDKIICAKNCGQCRLTYSKNRWSCPDMHSKEYEELHGNKKNSVRHRIVYIPDEDQENGGLMM